MSTDKKASEISGEAADQEPITPSSETEGSGHGAEGGAGGPIILFPEKATR
jgi:hypothetical protein